MIKGKYLLLVFLSISTGLLTSCGEDSIAESAGGGVGGGIGDVDVPEEDINVNTPTNAEVCQSPICFEFQTRWEETLLSKISWGTCTANAVGDTCTIQVPEATLYFSDLYYEISTNSNDCVYLVFEPYFYRISTSASYIDPSLETQDCSGATEVPPAICFNGVATNLIESFPSATQAYFKTDQATSIIYKADSANQVRNTTSTFGSFYSVNQGLPTVDTTVANGTGSYVISYSGGGGGFGFLSRPQNYALRCKDAKGEDLATLKFIIEDLDNDFVPGDTTEDPVDDFLAW